MYTIKNKNGEIININKNETYYIGFTYYVREMLIREIQGDYDMYKEPVKVITSCKKVPEETDDFEEWYKSNKHNLYEFNKDFVKGVMIDIISSIYEGIIEINYVSGYFPLAICKMKGDEIINKIKELD